MNEWIAQSGDFLLSVASLLTSEPFFYLIGLFILIIACKLFKSTIGG